jgi:DNA-binding NtrC family response regulator
MVAEGDLVELSMTLFDFEKQESKKSFFGSVKEFERKLLVEALLAADGNKSEAARILGLHEATVRTKLKRYGIDQPSAS